MLHCWLSDPGRRLEFAELAHYLDETISDEIMSETEVNNKLDIPTILNSVIVKLTE